MYSFVFLGERNKSKVLEELTSKVRLSTATYQVIFLTNKTEKKETLSKRFPYINFKIISFKETTTDEEMVESLIQSQQLGSMILFKASAENINYGDVARMIQQNSNGAKIVVSTQTKKDNLLKKVLRSIKSFFIRLFFSVKVYNGEADIILLDEILVSTIVETPGKSAILTKLNVWSGVEPRYVTINEQPRNKKEKITFKNLIPSIVCAGIFLGMIVGNILFSVLHVSMPFLGMFGYIVGEIAVFGLFVYYFSKFLFKLEFGNISLIKTVEIEQIIENGDEY